MKAFLAFFCCFFVLAISSLALGDSTAEPGEMRKHLRTEFDKGNFKDAFEGFRKLMLDPQDNPEAAGDDVYMAVECLKRLNRVNEADALLEEAVKIHASNWRLLWRAAQVYCDLPDDGFIIVGKFYRGSHRGGDGRVVNAVQRDRVRALQLMVQAMPLALKDNDRNGAAAFLQSFAQMFLNHRGYDQAWRMQYLTDLSVLPDYDDGWYMRSGTTGAPVDADGNPIFYTTPKSFEAAENDGQRWRWCMAQAVELNPRLHDDIQMEFAGFLQNQFGVETLAQYGYGWAFGRMETDDTQETQSGIFALHTLKNNETIARLANGVKRFDLPDEFNYILLYQEVAAGSQSSDAVQALEQLAQIYENRRQYPQAADYWQRLLKEYPAEQRNRRENWQRHYDQIVKNWGRFEPVQNQPAGRGATVDFRFRNATFVNFTAEEIDVDRLLTDAKILLKSNPRKLDHQNLDLENIGYRLIQEKQKKYIGRQVAEWRMPLTPRKDHFDSRVTVATPLQKPGAYLVTAKITDGVPCFIVLWVDDTAIVQKPLLDKNLYFVADAVTGKPVPKANVEFFGWRMEQRERPVRHEIVTTQFAEKTDENGLIVSDPKRQLDNMQWLVIAKTQEGRFAFLGFDRIWYGRQYDAAYNETKVYTITDRPVYRPDQTVHYKFWIRHAQYDMGDTSEFGNRRFTVEIFDPQDTKITEKTVQSDAYGGIEGEYTLPKDATLGVYSLNVKTLGGGSFRVEEYKKPEYEVTVDAPTEPIKLGDKITATITAKYYFGSPVTKAKVKYKVQRTEHDERWYPIGPWDWFYGPGYWWFAYDYDWYPGWHNWGCLRPTPFWWPRGHNPPELVADQEVEIGPDGTVKVEIDTGLAKTLYPNQDQSYSITAEVIDASRRTIVGLGKVLVAKKPFTVYAWLDRGYYRVNDAITAHFSARTLDGKPVQGQGELQLLKISYKDGKPVETVAQQWQLDTNEQGEARQQLTASQAGQYRLAYRLSSRPQGEQAEHFSPRPLAGEGQGVRAGDSSAAVDATANSPHPNPLPEGEGTKNSNASPDGEGTKTPKSDQAETIEGGYVFTVTGEGFNGSDFRFNHLELVPDKREYAPGETVKMQINTDRTGGTVLLFVRPTNGVYLLPKILRLDGKSTIEEIGVVQKDMPNFFVEAVTVADGRVYCETKEIVVPPEKRILNVAIEPSKEAYKPGEKANAKIRLTDFSGEPFVGTTVVAIYDKSLEYISGGSNVPDIKAFFWKWRRHHHPSTQSCLDRWSHNLVDPKATGMENIGLFGEDIVDGASNGRDRNEKYASTDHAMPMKAAPQMMQLAVKSQGGMAGGMGGGMGAGMLTPDELFEQAAQPLVEPTVRTKFADTALWVGALTTEKDGTAEVSLDMPENLTTWRIKVWGLGQGTRVGQGQTDVVTRKDLIVRLEAPRFFVQTDEVVLSAIVHNYLKTGKKVEVALELDGGCLELLPDGGKPSQSVEVAADGEARVDWRVKTLDQGEAVIRMKALTDEESDAMEQRFPCYIHGMLKQEAFSGTIRPKQDSGQFTINVPSQRRPADSRLEVRFSPTLAGAMVDALPYLVDYPYGCTEQTLNRFLPTVITQKVLLDMDLDLKAIEKKRTNLNAQEIGDDAERAKQWANGNSNSPHPNPLPEGEGTENGSPRPQAGEGQGVRVDGLPVCNPVFDVDEVQRMVKDGVQRLTEMQCSDGGWGWFSGWGEHSSPHTTALVVHGLQLAEQNDVALVSDVLEQGIAWLETYQNEQIQLLKNAEIKDKPSDLRWKSHADDNDAFVYMVLADADKKNAEMCAFLDRDRTQLAVYGMTMFGLALERQDEREKLAQVMKNLSQYVEQDDENQTAWLRLPGGYWWCWYGSEYEAQAYYLKLLAHTDPEGELAPRLVKYLLNNRKHATYWNSTRDTAICVEAFADFLHHSGEDRPNMTVEVLYDGQLQKTVEISSENLFTFDNKFVLEGDKVATGRHTVELRRKGTGPLYFNGYLTTFTLEDFIRSAGLEVKVNRKYYKLVKIDQSTQVAGSRGQVVDQKVEKYERQELPNDAFVQSGDLVEVELEIDSKNDYEYLIFEDMKPAGFEPVDVRSGYNGNELNAYVEFRDNRVVFFSQTLARGKHSVSYRTRAEIPGRFSALPTRAWAMYAPELKGNSDELKIGVKD